MTVRFRDRLAFEFIIQVMCFFICIPGVSGQMVGATHSDVIQRKAREFSLLSDSDALSGIVECTCVMVSVC
ncbi:MAG: hypothetical protein MZV63_20245 [Marinilabiliales bacterium]|nr:hypothetical protein [Marinilabiliales bacterium]